MANVNKAYNGLNQDATIAAIGTGACAPTGAGYDCNGSLTNDGTRTFTYDAENRLLTAAIPSTATTATLAYDPLGRLQSYATTISGTPSATTFLYDGDRLSAEYNGTTLLRRYVHGVGEDVPLVWYEGPLASADRRWLHTDNQGSVIAWSNASGAVTPISYGAYGEPQAWSGSRFSYTGQIMLPEIKLYHYKARAYDPMVGRFLQTDPVGYDAGPNLYEYVEDDPTDKTDPTGDCPECLLGAAIEVGFELYTGELQGAVSQAEHGNYGGLAVSAGKIGVSALSGGLSSVAVKGSVALAVRGAEALGAGAKLTTAARVAGVVAGQAANGAATKVGTNAVSGKPLGDHVGTAAVVSGVVGTAGHYAARGAESAAGVLGANAGAVAKVATKVVSGEVKKETTCSASNGKPC